MRNFFVIYSMVIISTLSHIDIAFAFKPIPPKKQVKIEVTEFLVGQHICGEVKGLPESKCDQYKVIVYVRTDKWYIHPYAEGGDGLSFASLNPDCSWKIKTVDRWAPPREVAFIVVEKMYEAPHQVSYISQINYFLLFINEWREVAEPKLKGIAQTDVIVSGYVYDSATNEALQDVKVIVQEAEDLSPSLTNKNGKYTIVISNRTEARITFSKEGYQSTTNLLKLSESNLKHDVRLEMQRRTLEAEHIFLKNTKEYYTNGSWKVWALPEFSGGQCINNEDPYHMGQPTDAALYLDFEGTEVIIIYRQDIWYGRLAVEIDKNGVGFINQRGPIKNQMKEHFKVSGKGKHSLVLRGSKATGVITIDAIHILGSPKNNEK